MSACTPWTLLVVLILGACGDDIAPPTQDSGPRRDTSEPEDAGVDEEDVEEDARVDATDTDAGDAIEPDAGADVAIDMNVPDMGPPPPVVVCEDLMGMPPRCPPMGCEAGFSCHDEFCRGQACVPGRGCLTDADCGAGVCEKPAGSADVDPGLCAFEGDCTSDLECALGFLCEAGTCVDRRIPCGFHANNCPRGHSCTFAPVEGLGYCVPAQTPCENDAQCEAGASCHDVDGDGDDECVAAGLCSSNADCAGDTSCGIDPGTSQAACVIDGACADGACPAGFECADLGDGNQRCVAEGGTCSAHSDCEPGSICGSVEPGDPPRCLTYDEESS